jgi:hypothetical protein
MRKAPVTTLNDLLARRDIAKESTGRPVWDTPLVGLSMVDDVFDQFVNQVLETSGFVWGSSIWGVDAIDDETSSQAENYDLN